MLLVLLACGQSPHDAQSYLAALDDPSACAAIADADLRGECAGMGAMALAREGRVEEAGAVCASLGPGAWQDECHFLVADGAGVHGAEARRLCAAAGRWWQQCIGHAINREAKVIFDAAGEGREPETQARLLEMIGTYVGGREAGEKARRLMVAHIAARTADTFTRASCGAADEDLCRNAYIEKVRLVALGVGETPVLGQPEGEPWRGACGRFVTVERATAAGWPGWDAAADPVVQEAWHRLCAR